MIHRPKIYLTPVIVFAVSFVWSLVVFSTSALARSQDIRFIRDAEVEHTIRLISTPIFQSAGLAADSVRIYIIEDKNINAFVTGGQRIFVHTGLLMAGETPLELAGVMAHETGHIAGGHLVRTRDAFDSAVATQVASFLLGIGAAASGAGADAATAIVYSGRSLATTQYFAFSRAQESSADHAALRYLRENDISAQGLRNILKTLEGQELLIGVTQNPYLRTHPQNRDRVASVDQQLSNEDFTTAYPPEWTEPYARMLAKLRGFLWHPGKVGRSYPETDQSLPAQYARAISAYRSGETNSALRIMTKLVEKRPDDPYFQDFLGQMAFEMGNFELAVTHYRQAAQKASDSYLILSYLGQALVTTNHQANADEAEKVLKTSLDIEPDQTIAWHNLAILYGRQGRNGEAALAAAERFYRSNKRDQAKIQLSRALDLLPEGSANWQRAMDIDNALKSKKK